MRNFVRQYRQQVNDIHVFVGFDDASITYFQWCIALQTTIHLGHTML